jgi:hypothetical protein
MIGRARVDFADRQYTTRPGGSTVEVTLGRREAAAGERDSVVLLARGDIAELLRPLGSRATYPRPEAGTGV